MPPPPWGAFCQITLTSCWCYWSCQKVSQFFEIFVRNTIWSNWFIWLNIILQSSEWTFSISTVYWDGRGDNLFLKSSNHNWSIAGMCLVTSHKCILIVLAKLELSTGTEWYNMLLKHLKSDGWWHLLMVFIFFHHCDALPFLNFWTLSKKYWNSLLDSSINAIVEKNQLFSTSHS